MVYAVTASLAKSVPSNLFANHLVLTLRLSKKIPAGLGHLSLDSDAAATFDLQAIPQGRDGTDMAVIHVGKDQAQFFAAPQPVTIEAA